MPETFTKGVCIITENDMQLKGLRDPESGAPLEPAPEYGSSIMYNPYTGAYVMVTVPEGKAVKPRFTKTEETSLKIAKTALCRAAGIVKTDKSYVGLEKAFRVLEPTQAKPQMYPHITEDPAFREVRDATQYVLNMLRSSGGETNEFIERGRERILTATQAVAGVC